MGRYRRLRVPARFEEGRDASGLLSIKFNVDGINMDFKSTDFMCGRIVGTIGPATKEEPHHLVVGRQFMAANTPNNQSFFQPVGGLNFCVARVDAAAKSIFVDLGNALPTGTPGSGLANVGDLTLSFGTTPLGTIPAAGANGYTGSGWYGNTAGVVVLHAEFVRRSMATGVGHPLTITGNSQTSIAEWTTGAFVRADAFVFR